MYVVILGINFRPELTGTGKYTGEMTAYLAQKHQIRVITAPPYYPEWEIQKPYSAWLYKKEKREGVEVYRSPLWVPKNPSGAKRLLHLLSFAIFSFPLILKQKKWQPQIIINIAPSLFSAVSALFLAKLTGAKSWLHIQDFEVDAAFNLGILPQRGFLHKLALSFEHYLLSHFDRVSTISANMLSLAIEKGTPPEKATFFPNWVDTKEIYPLEKENKLRLELGIPSNQKIALYHGNLGKKQGLNILVETAHLLEKNTDILFLIAGEGAVKEELQEKAKGMKNIHFLDLQPLEKLNELVNLADFHLLPQRAGAADLVMPSKLTTMLASGKAVIAGAEEKTQLWKVVNQVGLVVPPENAEALAKAILNLYNSPAQAENLGKKGRKYALQNLEKEIILAKFEKELRDLNTTPQMLEGCYAKPTKAL